MGLPKDVEAVGLPDLGTECTKPPVEVTWSHLRNRDAVFFPALLRGLACFFFFFFVPCLVKNGSLGPSLNVAPLSPRPCPLTGNSVKSRQGESGWWLERSYLQIPEN